MATYVILNSIFLAALGIAWLILKPKLSIRRVYVTVAIILFFTAVFDSLIVGLGIVDYDFSKTLGIFIGTAPIEDFFYAIMAGILIPLVWTIIGNKYERKN